MSPSNPRREAEFGVRAPRQARSREAMRRMLDTAERLLEDSAFDDISVAEIARAAGVTIGSLYLRFPNKEALVDAVHARYSREAQASIAEFSRPETWEGRSLDERVRGLVRFVVDLYRSRRAVVRSMSLYYRVRPALAPKELIDRNDRMFQDLASVLMGARSEIRGDDPERSAHFACQLVVTLCREKILFPDFPVPDRSHRDDGQLIRDLHRTVLAMLTAPD